MDQRQQAALNFLTEEISREREFMKSDDFQGGSILPLLRKMHKQVAKNQLPTLADVEAWSMQVYDQTRGLGMYGDSDLVDGLAQGLTQALELSEESV